MAGGRGGNLITKELVAKKDFDGLAAKTRQVTEWITTTRAARK